MEKVAVQDDTGLRIPLMLNSVHSSDQINNLSFSHFSNALRGKIDCKLNIFAGEIEIYVLLYTTI